MDKKLIEFDFQNFENDPTIRKFWTKKRILRQNKRKVFAGKLRLKNLFKSKKFIKAFILELKLNGQKTIIQCLLLQ